MKKILALLLAAMMLLSLPISLAEQAPAKLNIVTTIFPIYDWVRNILGDRVNEVNLTLLLDKGTDLHSYQPTVDDMLKVAQADLFIYVGGESDGWVDNALKAADNPNRKVLNLVELLGDAVKTEETVEGMEEGHGHEHGHDHNHGHNHSHGKSQFEDSEVQDRTLSDWAGEWQSVYPYLMDGTLDHVMEHKAEDGSKTAEEYKAYYEAGYKTDVEAMTITDKTMTFVKNGVAATAEYAYKGYKILTYASGKKGVRYFFEAVGETDAPKYVQFSDHEIGPTKAAHYHIFAGNESFDALLEEMENWPTYYPANLTAEQIVDEMLGHDHAHSHEEEKDEHVWLSLRNAVKLVDAITAALTELDADHADLYKQNAAAYTEKLTKLDGEYEAVVNAAANKTVLFGDRFPFRYLVDDYGLQYYAAFVGCSAETEASFKTIAFLAGKVDELKLPAVLTIEGAEHEIAKTVVANTTDKNQAIVTMNSMQSVTAADVEAGADYFAIMQENLEAIKTALK